LEAAANINVLVIEDEVAIADTILYALRTEGMHATQVTLGRSALERLRQEQFSIAIVDVGLPDYNGFDLCRELRAFSNIPVIFLTARAEEIDRIVGLEIGADDYVTKPFSPRELAARVRVIHCEECSDGKDCSDHTGVACNAGRDQNGGRRGG
jgi:two-component system catabolic regulation response regulator CreB